MATITSPAANSTGTSAWADSVAAALNARVPVINSSSTAASSTAGTEIKDTAVGDLTLTVTDATAWYIIRYVARGNSTVAGDTMDVRIRDGGSSSPTNTSTQIAGQSFGGLAGGSTGASMVVVETQPIQFTAATHIVAAFYIRTFGTGNVIVSSASGANRFLTAMQVA